MFITAGKFYRRKLAVPKGSATRPTASKLRQAVFNILQNEIEGTDFLDVFAGSGAMGFEALSRGAKHATFIEAQKPAIFCLKANIGALKVHAESAVLAGDFLAMLKKLKFQAKQFDLIYADAPYGMLKNGSSASQNLFEYIAQNDLLRDQGQLFIENDQEEPYESQGPLLWKSTRRSGKAFLHHYIKGK